MPDVATIFAAGGPLEHALPGFESRPQQVRMASEVMAAIAGGRHLLVEAGTGIGKSLAYLIPAILHATHESQHDPDERRIIISTHTRALQEQLARKDLPFLERALAPAGIHFRHALLMGSENYLCVQRLAEQRLKGKRLIGDGESELLDRLARHAESAPTGLRSEIPFPVPTPVWGRVRRDRDICLGARGPYWEDCLYRLDLARSREAHLLVVNHALFFLDLATGGRVLPPHRVAILDEAHRIEEVAISQFGVSIAARAVSRLLDDLKPGERSGNAAIVADSPITEQAARVDDASQTFFEEVRRAAEGLRTGRDGGDRVPGRGRDSGGVVRVRRAGLADNRLADPLEALEGAIAEEVGTGAEPLRALALEGLAARARDLRLRVATFLEQRMGDAVYWVDLGSGPRRSPTLHATPIEIAPVLRQQLFNGARSVVLTSATLTAASSFSHVKHRMGLTGATEVALGSPFDYRRQALLYLPPTMPEPSATEPFALGVIDECRRILRASDGGALVLFTSYALLRRVHEALSADRTLAGLKMLRHEPGVASPILEELRATRRGVLFGTLTFWQGVDVPGDALRCVIITRLPFEVPDHPLVEARSEMIRGRGGEPFTEDSLPEAILTFRQGFGRLIRSREDRGLVAILDPRVTTRPYGASFLESLPDCRRTESIVEVRRFFAAGRK